MNIDLFLIYRCYFTFYKLESGDVIDSSQADRTDPI